MPRLTKRERDIIISTKGCSTLRLTEKAKVRPQKLEGFKNARKRYLLSLNELPKAVLAGRVRQVVETTRDHHA